MVMGGKQLSWNGKSCCIESKVLEEVGKTIQHHKPFTTCDEVVSLTLVTPNPGSDHEPNLETAAQIVAEMLTHMFNGF